MSTTIRDQTQSTTPAQGRGGMSATFKQDDIVIGRATTYSEQEHFGVVERDLEPGGLFLKAELVTGKNTTSFMVPGFNLELFRLATPEEVAAAPQYFWDWLEKKRLREELQLLNQRDPIVFAANRKVTTALRNAGIERVSDLDRFSDKELLALDGIGSKFINNWRQIQSLKEQEANVNG